MKRVVCLWGGPGTGKSTTCAGIFNMLKKKGYDCEMNREYVKEWVWEGRKIQNGDQVYFTAKQARRESNYIRNNLDFIITDSPIALACFYGNKYDKYEREFQASRAIVKQHYEFCKDHGYKVEHYFLKRTKAYNPNGRNEDEATARQYDEEIKAFLTEFGINYKTVVCDDNVEESIVSDLLSRS